MVIYSNKIKMENPFTFVNPCVIISNRERGVAQFG